ALIVDHRLFATFGFHVNGFVLNLLTTRGGLASLGASTETVVATVAIVVGLIVLQTVLLAAARRIAHSWVAVERLRPRRVYALVFVALLTLCVSERVVYAVSDL